MPFQSERQRRFMWSQHPDIAEAWAHGRHTSKGPHRMAKKHKKHSKRSSKKGKRY